MRADDIKQSYLSTGAFKDLEQFDCGKIIKYEIQEDLNLMKGVFNAISEYLDTLNKHTFREVPLFTYKDLLEKRINEFKIGKTNRT